MAHRYKARGVALALAMAGAALAASAAAQNLGGLDAPFRPRASPPATRSAAAAAAEEGDYAPGLRVMVTGRQRPVASIDGRLVHVGDEVNGMQVVRIDAKGVLLAGDDGVSERLTVAPAVQKRPLTAQPGEKGVQR
jgi:hypothetical protein